VIREVLIPGDSSAGISVVVPVYNAGPYLERCVKSLLRQTLPRDRYELIFVDDGSTDGSGARLDAVAAEHPDLVRVVHIPNSGWPGRPRNLGTDEARRPYVFYCDADDWLPEYALLMLLDRVDRDRSDVVITRRMGARGTGPYALFERGDYCTTWQRTPAVFHTLTCQKMFRRAFLQEQGIRFPEGKVRLEDYIFMVQAYLKSERISIVGSRPSYVLDRREDRGNLTATKADEDDYWRSVERVIELIVELTNDGPERDVALDRVVRSELIGSVSDRAHVAKPEDVRIRAFGFAHRLLEERVPPSAVRRLDSLTRRRAELITAGDRVGLERLTAWYAGVGAKVTATDASWRDGRLVVTLRAHLEHDGEPLELTWAGGRLTLSTPTGDGTYPLDVTTEVPRSAVHVVLRDLAVDEDRRVQASLQLDLAEDATSGRLGWTATAEIDPLTAAGGQPLRPAEWNLLVAVASCGWSHVRPLVVPAEVPAPAPALLGSASTVVIPFRRRRTGLSLDVGPSSRSLADEVARRRVGAACVEGPDVTVPLPIVTDTDAAVQVELRAEDGTPPRVGQGRLVGSPEATSLRLPVDAVPIGVTWWYLHLALGGSAVPLGLAVNRSPGLGARVRQSAAAAAAERPRRHLATAGAAGRRRPAGPARDRRPGRRRPAEPAALRRAARRAWRRLPGHPPAPAGAPDPRAAARQRRHARRDRAAGAGRAGGQGRRLGVVGILAGRDR
jgi:glycosyltransferase involved in cell wall biosynthesis